MLIITKNLHHEVSNYALTYEFIDWLGLTGSYNNDDILQHIVNRKELILSDKKRLFKAWLRKEGLQIIPRPPMPLVSKMLYPYIDDTTTDYTIFQVSSERYHSFFAFLQSIHVTCRSITKINQVLEPLGYTILSILDNRTHKTNWVIFKLEAD